MAVRPTAWSLSDVKVIHHCKDFIVVDKPYDLKINSDVATEATLATLLRDRYPHTLVSLNIQ